MSRPAHRVAVVVLGFGAATIVACAGELENPERFASCPPGFVEQLFMEKCAGECHTAVTPEAGLDLVSPGAAQRLIGVVSSQDACADMALVDPAGEAHLVLEKLGDTPPCGARMPFGQAELDPAEVECVRRWVDEVVAAGGGA